MHINEKLRNWVLGLGLAATISGLGASYILNKDEVPQAPAPIVLSLGTPAATLDDIVAGSTAVPYAEQITVPLDTPTAEATEIMDPASEYDGLIVVVDQNIHEVGQRVYKGIVITNREGTELPQFVNNGLTLAAQGKANNTWMVANGSLIQIDGCYTLDGDVRCILEAVGLTPDSMRALPQDVYVQIIDAEDGEYFKELDEGFTPVVFPVFKSMDPEEMLRLSQYHINQLNEIALFGRCNVNAPEGFSGVALSRIGDGQWVGYRDAQGIVRAYENGPDMVVGNLWKSDWQIYGLVYRLGDRYFGADKPTIQIVENGHLNLRCDPDAITYEKKPEQVAEAAPEPTYIPAPAAQPTAALPNTTGAVPPRGAVVVTAVPTATPTREVDSGSSGITSSMTLQGTDTIECLLNRPLDIYMTADGAVQAYNTILQAQSGGSLPPVIGGLEENMWVQLGSQYSSGTIVVAKLLGIKKDGTFIPYAHSDAGYVWFIADGNSFCEN